MKIKSYLVNILDLIVLFLVLSVLFSFVFNDKNKQIELLFEKYQTASVVIDLNDENIDSDDFSIGEKVYLKDTGECIGTVSKSVNLLHKIYYPDNGILLFEYGSDVVGVRLTIDSKIKSNEKGTFVNGSEFIVAGESITVNTKNVDNISGIIYDIER